MKRSTAVICLMLLAACAAPKTAGPTSGLVDMTGVDPVSGITPAMQAKSNAAVESKSPARSKSAQDALDATAVVQTIASLFFRF